MKVFISSLLAVFLVFGLHLSTEDDIDIAELEMSENNIVNLKIVDVISDSIKEVPIESEDLSVSIVGDMVIKELNITEKCIKEIVVKDNIVIVNFVEDSIVLHQGTSGELAILDSLAKTFVDSMGYDNIIFRVNDNNYESGHIVFELDEVYYAGNK